ncbi:MAG: alpha/beta fold hydrolase [Cyanobacteriota bacterium]|nr:alpha/beta fold hydrolase [Cyanobacteriota bacterium]
MPASLHWPPPPFQQRWPWIGPDLQTIRDTVHPDRLPAERGVPWTVSLPAGGRLLLVEDRPAPTQILRAWVLLVHGLGGSSGRPGVRRLALTLQEQGFGVWRLNLRGAGEGRRLATGTYAAACNSDLLPVLAAARLRAAGLPLLGAGLSLGGTVLLNALLEQPDGLDALACVSSPLDLDACGRQIDAPRNRLYQKVLLRGLIRQTLADRQAGSFAVPLRSLRSIRQFDAAVTAPRWGHPTVDHYYRQASPLPALLSGVALPATLLVHALDDPWVPAASVLTLRKQAPPWLTLCLPSHGGHNGFHAVARGAQGGKASWADRWVAGWLKALSTAAAEPC